jgi:hypothetical protein
MITRIVSNGPRRAGRTAVRVLVGGAVIATEVVRPLYSPFSELIVRPAFSRSLLERVGRLPPYGILALLAVPFLGAEPLKIVGIYWMATGHPAAGTALLVVAYGTSLIVVERLYAAGRDSLRTIGWFEQTMCLLTAMRDGAMSRVSKTTAWQRSMQIALHARRAFTRLRAYRAT